MSKEIPSDYTTDVIGLHSAYFETVDYIINRVTPDMERHVIETKHQRETTKFEFRNRKKEMTT